MEVLFKSVEEHPEEAETEIKGTIPPWIHGRLVRVGPGKFDFGTDFTLNHWFDGCAFLYSFILKNGKVTFKSRYVESDAYHKMCEVKRPVFMEFGTRSYPDPAKNAISRIFSQLIPFDLTDNDVSNVFSIGDECYVTTETCYLWKFDPLTLKSVEKVNLTKLTNMNVASAHPQTAPDGTVYNLATSYSKGIKYHILKIDPLGGKEEKASAFHKASIHATIQSSWKTCYSYYHSFQVTENYIVFEEQPFVVNSVKLIAATAKGQALKDVFDWNPKEKTRFVVIDRHTGNVHKTKYAAEPFFAFHHINGYEEDNHIVLDIVTYPNPEVLDKFYLDKLRSGVWGPECEPEARRFVIPLGKDSQKGVNLVTLENCNAKAVKDENGVIMLTEEKLARPGFECPTTNPKFNGKKYRYIFATGAFEQGYFKNSVCKFDLVTRQLKLWKESDTTYPGEMIYVENPESDGAEDSGVLMSVVADCAPGSRNYLLILKASDMTEVGRAYLDPSCQVSCTTHGMFVKNV